MGARLSELEFVRNDANGGLVHLQFSLIPDHLSNNGHSVTILLIIDVLNEDISESKGENLFIEVKLGPRLGYSKGPTAILKLCDHEIWR